MWNLLGESIIAECESCRIVNGFIIEKSGNTIKEGHPENTSQDISSVTEFSIKDFDETLTAIHIILSKIRDDNTSKAIGSSNIEYMMVLGQALRGGLCLIEDILENLNETPPDTEKIQLLTNSLLYLLARILAVSMGIVNFDSLYEGIALSIMHTKPRYKGPVDKRAFSILNSEEIIKEKHEKNGQNQVSTGQ